VGNVNDLGVPKGRCDRVLSLAEFPVGLEQIRVTAAWQQVGVPPIGRWHLAFNEQADPVFADGVADVVLLLSWQAQSPAWPT
jgi:hypothetical protein